MPKQVIPLTDSKIKNAKSKNREYQLTDGHGLFLLIYPKGSKSWKFQYRIDGKQKVISFGTYPEITLAKARELRLTNRTLVANGEDPKQKKKISEPKKSETVEVVSKKWLNKVKVNFSKSNTETIEGRLRNYIYPVLGSRDISTVEPIELVQILENIQNDKKIDTAHRMYGILSRIWKFAKIHGKVKYNITADIEKRDILYSRPKNHYPAITDPRKVGILLNNIEEYTGYHIVKLALKFMPHVFVRPANIRFMEWVDVDLGKKCWTIPAIKMKMKKAHRVPLSSASMTILKEVKALNKSSKYVFPAPRNERKAMSENTLNSALRRLGYTKDEIVSHSFRHTASTMLHENISVHGFSSNVIELQLAHVEKNEVKDAYNNSTMMKDRIKLMMWWSDYLEGLERVKSPLKF